MMRPSRRTIAAALMSETVARPLITRSRSAQTSAISPSPHDDFREDLECLTDALPLRRDGEHDGIGLGEVHPLPDLALAHCPRKVRLVCEDHVRHALLNEVQHLPGPPRFLRPSR